MSKKSFKEDIWRNQKMNCLSFKYFKVKTQTEKEKEEEETKNNKKRNKNNKKMNGKIFMAFAAAQQMKEVEFKQYIGYGDFKVISVCPSKKELDEIYGGDSKEPVYVSTVDRNGTPTQQVRIDFILKNDNIDTIFKKSFFVLNAPFKSQAGKFKIIDKYGRTAWATEDDINNKRIPVYSNGPADIDQDYRKAYRGEEELTNFIKTYCYIPNLKYADKNTGEIKTISNPSSAEARLDTIKDFFNGNFNEIRMIIASAQDNTVKCLVGIKTTDNGAYHDIFDYVMKSSSKNISSFEKKVNEAKQAGRYANTEFSFGPLHEYKVTETDFKELKQKAQDDIDGLPF